jgi:hypothetical protein
MKKLFVTLTLGTLLHLATGAPAHAGAKRLPLVVEAKCPLALNRAASNVITLKVHNKGNTERSINRFAISYAGNTASGPIISGPFVQPVPPVTLLPGDTQQFQLDFPAVPPIYPLDTVVTAIGAIFVRNGGVGSGGIIGAGNCLAPVVP